MATKKRNRADSRAHTSCPVCQRKQHGERGLKMHLMQVHDLTPIAAATHASPAATVGS